MTLPINIKFRVLPRFPAQVIGREGIAVTKQNGIYYFDLDYADFPPQSSIPAGMSPYQLMWDPVSNTYVLVPASVTGLADAPNDTYTYGRHALSWVQILPLSGGTMTGPLILSSGATALGDAPSDGALYGRKNATWTAVSSVGGASVTISDTAPTSGLASGNLWWQSSTGQMYIYYNDGTSAQWVLIGAASANSVAGPGGSTPAVYTTAVTGAGTYVVPAGYINMVGEAWGAGGGGANSLNAPYNGGGGGGYSKFSTAVTTGQTIYFNVGVGGIGNSGGGVPTAGGNSWVNPSVNSQPSSNGCVGGGGGAVGGGGGPGSVGTTNYQGGSGFGSGGGGGGGGAGSGGNGLSATSATGAAGGTPDGGAGSNGTTTGTIPPSGTVPGGGGGGSSGGPAGAGGSGQIKLTFT